MSIRIADGTQIFKCRLYFFKFKFKFPQRYIADILCFACNLQIPQANRIKGDRLPFATALKIIWVLFATCQKEMVYRLQFEKK